MIFPFKKTNAICVTPSHGKETLTNLFELLTEEQRAAIRLVSADGTKNSHVSFTQTDDASFDIPNYHLSMVQCNFSVSVVNSDFCSKNT